MISDSFDLKLLASRVNLSIFDVDSCNTIAANLCFMKKHNLRIVSTHHPFNPFSHDTPKTRRFHDLE